MPSYSWITLTQAVNALQGRLQSNTFWSFAECQSYLTESLRVWSALTDGQQQGVGDFVFTASGTTWNNLGTIANSPRLRTVTDQSLYSQMLYMLLEPQLNAGVWAGTNQFNLPAFQFALQRRVTEVIQACATNLVNLPPIPYTPGPRRTLLPDTILEPIRMRIIPSRTPTDFGPPLTLTREDTQAFQYFEPGYLQTFDTPTSWSEASEPPLAIDVNNAPNDPGTYDLIALQSGPIFAPPASSLLGIPDDWSWVPMYGALADLLASDPERTDMGRAQYCLKRFTDGIEIMRQSNWLLQAAVNGVAVSTPSLFSKDWTSPEWQDDPNQWPCVVQAGMDFVSVAPAATQSVNLTLVGNAPVPLIGSDFLQIPRDVFDGILSYAEHLATFKEGGQEWSEKQSLEMDFYRAAADTNKRLHNIGIYTDILHSAGQRQNVDQPR